MTARGWLPPSPGDPFQGSSFAAHLPAVPWLHSSLCLAFDTGEAFAVPPLPHRGTGSCLRPPRGPPSLAPPPALGQASSKPPFLAKHTGLRDPRDAAGARVFHYSPACEISLGTQLSAAFPLALNIFAEGCQKVKEFSRRKAPLVRISGCK